MRIGKGTFPQKGFHSQKERNIFFVGKCNWDIQYRRPIILIIDKLNRNHCNSARDLARFFIDNAPDSVRFSLNRGIIVSHIPESILT